jgi:hypothetical protein
MGNISDSVLLDEIDFIAAVVKAQSESYSATVDAYDFMVREQNPDDLLNGVDASVSLRTTLANMTSLFSQFSQMTSWLNARAVSAGSSGLDTLLTARNLRVPYSYDKYIYYPSGSSHLTQGNIFYDSEVILGWMKQDGTFSAMSDLTLSGTYNWLAMKVGVAAIGGDWWLDAKSVYADNSTGTERVYVPNGATQNTLVNIGQVPVSGLAKAGTNVIPMTLGTTGMLAGQKVLIADETVPALLSTGADASQRDLYLAPSQIGWYTTGDHVWIRDGSNSETGIIEDMDWQNGIVTMRDVLAKTYTVAANANIYKATGFLGTDGWQEAHTIASVSAAQALAFSATLQHTYFTAASAIRLIKDVFDVTNSSGGTTADIVWVVTKSERAISQ